MSETTPGYFHIGKPVKPRSTGMDLDEILAEFGNPRLVKVWEKPIAVEEPIAVEHEEGEEP